MALKHVKSYYEDMLNEFLEAKENQQEMINEYKQGNINEEQLEEFNKYYNDLEVNYTRLSYIMYLFNIPARNKKLPKYIKSNKDMIDYFKKQKATKEDIRLENKDMLVEMRKIIKGEK